MSKIVAIDIETPNKYHDRICSIGLTIIDGGSILSTIQYLVNPETEFDPVNIEIHGIRPIDVQDAPKFPEVWNEISGIVCSELIVAHNATFDLCVLRKTLQAYEIYESIVQYACTLEIARNTISGLDNYKLPTLCNHAGIDIEHHDAESDSKGCAQLFCVLVNSGIQLDTYVKHFNLTEEIEQRSRHTKYLTSENQSLKTLKDILGAITCDNILKEEEILFLQNWLNTNSQLEGHYPYDQIYRIVSSALMDGVLDRNELDLMLELFRKIDDPVSSSCYKGESLVITDKTIVLTGEFDRGDRRSIETELALMGAICKKAVTKITDYVIVGEFGSEAWCADNYGSKVKKALELQEKGLPIQIIKESEFFEALERS